MKCPVCVAEMVEDEHGYDCDNCEMYFSHAVIEAGVFEKEEDETETEC